jgi:peptide/nickel transport system ATP-binding protein
MILIGHDMGLTAQVLDRVGVMYAGKLVEVAPVQELFNSPRHPYTQALISSLPSVREKKRGGGIPGLPPFLLNPPPGCLFRPRCPHAFEPCHSITPPLLPVSAADLTACHLYTSEEERLDKSSANTAL